MRHHRFIIRIASAFLLLFSLASYAASNSNYHYVLSARWGVLKTDKASGTYTLVLHDVYPIVNYFSDRPKRKTGIMATDAFLKQSNAGLDHNVQVEGIRFLGVVDPKRNLNASMTLTKPNYDAKNKQLTYVVKSAPGILHDDHMIFRHVVLFFNNF